MSSLILPHFSKDTPNKIGNGLEVSEKNTLFKTEVEAACRVAIADEPIDAKVDGKKMFCARVDKAGSNAMFMMFGFTTMEAFDSSKNARFGWNGFTGCGISLSSGSLCYQDSYTHNIINYEISRKVKEIIVILTLSNNGKKKEIRFLCDGHETKSLPNIPDI